VRSIRIERPPLVGDAQVQSWLNRVYDAINAIKSDTSFVTITSNKSVVFHHGVVYGDCSASTLTASIPSSATWVDAMYSFKKIDSSANPLVVVPMSGNIEGAASLSIATQNVSYTVHHDGSEYRIV
jgi:hypothetical protein